MERITITIDRPFDPLCVPQHNWWDVEDGGYDIFSILSAMVPVLENNLACINISYDPKEKEE